jgi:lipid II:glycine glycyltransferase (peptidoglycan interpeptide bridge formation enzyme)
MRIEIITDSNFNLQWEKVASHPLQSWLFGEARRAMGLEILRIGQFLGNTLKNVFQMTIHRLPFGLKIGYLPRSVLPNKEVLNFFIQLGKKKKLIFIKIEPYIEQNKGKKELALILSTLPLKKSPHPLFPKWTQMIDLEKNEDELFAQCHYKTRYNIRLAKKKEVKVVEQSDKKGFKIFSDLYFQTCKRQHYHGHNSFYHQTIWQHLNNKIAHIMIAYYKNIPLSAYQLWHYKDNLYYLYGGSSDQHRNLMASNLLMWEAIRFGKKLKAKRFDLWGSLPPDYSLNHSWSGFTRFKQGYGSQFIEMIGSFDLIISPAAYCLYNIVYPIRQLMLRFI